MTGTAIQIQVVCHLLPVERNLKTMVAVFPGLCGQIGQQSAANCFSLKKCRKSGSEEASNFSAAHCKKAALYFQIPGRSAVFFPVKLSVIQKHFAVANGNGIYHHRFPAQGIGFCKNKCPSFIFPRMLLFPQKSMFSTFTLPDKTMPIQKQWNR